MKSVKSISDAVDKLILLRLLDFPQELIGQTTGVYNPSGWTKAKLLGFDNLGIWLENPNLQITWTVKKRKTIPASQQKPESYQASVLILWKYVGSIVCIDGHKSNADKNSTPIGFRPHTAKTR